MQILLGFILVLALGGCIYFFVESYNARTALKRALASAKLTADAHESRRISLEAETQRLASALARAEPWTKVADADDLVKSKEREASEVIRRAKEVAQLSTDAAAIRVQQLLREATERAAKAVAESTVLAERIAFEAKENAARSGIKSEEIIAQAKQRAEEIAGEAYEVVRDAQRYQRIVKAMKNIIEGYGDEYLLPADSVLDGLADEFSHKDAGSKLKEARAFTTKLIRDEKAAACDYAETSRREGAENFVLDAFNGKTDSILSRTRHDNFGVLAQEIKDAFELVNFGGTPFRNARITDVYLKARLEELRWGVAVIELKRQEQEEQRLIREQMREEEKARRDFERAVKEAAREEDILRKAMAKAQSQIAEATAEQRGVYEAQLAQLNQRLAEAEEKNQRAISMAQQTKRGHVYIVSNVGSFGETVYKIGLTRRLDPMDRIWELSDSSVPFDFDVHAMILAEDAPALECQLHKHFIMNQINKVNHRKEFFRASLTEIRREIELLGLNTKWTMTAEAREYRETLAIEAAIANDTGAREAWRNRQLTLDPTDVKELVAVGDE
jgi:hypothetical protein